VSKKNYNRIKVVLAEKNRTAKELATVLNKTESTVSRWCTNDVQPSVETLAEIAKYLDVDIRDLLNPTKEK
jgi:transcriptional regulator with XRE-family HTH domain